MKPMANRLTLLQRSAMQENLKVSTAASEILRRWKSTSEFLPRQEFERITSEYMDDLAAMGYTKMWREKVLGSTAKVYSRILGKCKNSDNNSNRMGVETFVTRRFNHLCGNQEWFKMASSYEERLQEIRRAHARRYAQARSVARAAKRAEGEALTTPAEKAAAQRQKVAKQKELASERSKRYRDRM